MPPSVPRDLLTRARQIILPLVGTEDDREALLTEAFYLHDPLLYGIERTGAAKVFAIRCIKKLLDHGCLTDDEHSLARLLETARYDCGVDKHPEIDTLTGIVNALCGDPKAMPPKSATTTPVTDPPQTVATPREDRTPTVFISYSHADDDFAQRLIADLQAAGHACWIDTSAIKGGDEWIMTIAEGIINSYAFVPLVTEKALQSRWVQDEILWARQKNKLIIPVILENVLGEKRFFPLISYQGVTLFDSDYATALPKLLSYLPAPSLPDVEVDEDEIEEEPAETAEEITVMMPRGVPRKLELAYMERLKLEELLNTEKYTEMSGTSQVQRKAEMRAVFELLPMGRDREQPQETRQFEDAVAEIQHIERCVLLGEPGGGKTTTIWKLAADLVETALNDRKAPIPLLVRLGKWTDAEQSLPDFIASQLGDLGEHLDTLLVEKRAALLLDGLNELPASQQKRKYPLVQRFVEQHPDLLAVVSCRELDYTLDLGFDRINITPLDPLRIREFAGRYLGETKGDALFWRLAGESAVNYHRWIMDDMVADGVDKDTLERIFWLENTVPEAMQPLNYKKEKRDPYGWRDWLKEREKPSGLMVLARNPYMLLMLTSVYEREGELPENRGELFREFVETLMEREGVPEAEQQPLVEGLAKVAYEMQIRRADAEGDASNALTVLPEATVSAILGDRLLYLAGSASILSVGEQIRFTHQLLQEYFAATYMDIEIKAGRLHATDIWQPDRWWERTNWEEAVILLAGLYSDDPTPVVKWLLDAQPEIAAQCINRSVATTPPDETLLLFRKHIPRLTDLESDPDPRARAAVGRALGQLLLSDGEPLDNRKGVSFFVRDGLQLPDIDWVTIPAGEFTYQDGKMTLDYDFQISRYSVTYVQFQAFIDDSEGFHDPRWWEGLAISDGHNDTPGDQRFKYWNHPRERVSWYDAMAFCRWLSWRLGGGYALDSINEWAVRLPTEFEWERAARGTDGREYPYEGKFDAAKGNTSATNIGQTSAVGIFPNGSSPEGVLDMSGNVWDSCLTDYKSPQERVGDEDIRSKTRRVLRGGSWYSIPPSPSYARAAFRHGVDPGPRNHGYGFRLLCVRAP